MNDKATSETQETPQTARPLLSDELAEYMTERELHDKGPWTVSVDGRSIESDDFTHDVILRVTGDFYCDEQRKAYADNLAAKLNAGLTANAGGKRSDD